MEKLFLLLLLGLGSWNLGLGASSKVDLSTVVLTKVDSLSARLHQSLHDTDRVNTLNALAWELRRNNPDTAIILSAQALKLAKKHDWHEGIGQSYHQLGEFN